MQRNDTGSPRTSTRTCQAAVFVRQQHEFPCVAVSINIDHAIFATTDVIDINDGKDGVAAGSVGGAVAMRVVDRLGNDTR